MSLTLPEADEFASRFPDEIRTLLAMLRMRNVGGLGIAECDDLDLRARLIDYFRRRLETDQIYVFTFEVSPKDINLARTLTELTEGNRFKNLELTGKYKSIVIFVYGIETLTPQQQNQFVRLLNMLRDRVLRIAQPIVIWGSAAFVSELTRNAPDFWSWQGHMFRFPSTMPLKVPLEKKQVESKDGYSHLPPIHRYLQRVVGDPDYAVWKDLYVPLKANRAGEAINPFAPRHTLTFPELRQIAPLFPTATSLPAQEIIINRGDQGQECYIIVTGEVEVLAPDALGNDIVVTKLGKGDFFGEIGLIKEVPRTATIRTTKPTKLITVHPSDLAKIKKRSQEVYDILTHIADRRLERRLAAPQQFNPLRRFAEEGSSLGKHPPIDVRDLIAEDRRTVVLGEAGGGKTTVLRRIMLDTAEHVNQMIESQSLIILPIFVQLNTLTPDITMERLILDIFRGYGIHELETEAQVIQLLKGNPLDKTTIHAFLFLLDGLNEMPPQPETYTELNRFIQQYSHHRVILSCRAEDYTPLQGFRTAMLQRLGSEDIDTFLVNYLRAERGRQVAKEIYCDPQLEDLAQTPLALYMFAQIAKRTDEALPKNRGVLFEVFIDNLLERTDNEWWKLFNPTKSLVPLTLRKNALAQLGLAIQQAEQWALSETQWLEIVEQQVGLYLQHIPPETAAELGEIKVNDVHQDIKHSGLLRYSTSRDVIEFAHHTYQEFFAALALRNNERDIETYLNTIENRRRWQGTIVLWYGIAHDKASLFSKILGAGHDYARIWLAAQCLANSGEDLTVALKYLERQVPLTQYSDLLFSVGLAARLLGRFPEAITYLHLATEQRPGSAEVQYELGSLYRQVEQYERAIQHLEEAIRLSTDFVDAYNQLGITYHNQDKFVEALTIFKATTQLEPANPHHFYNLGTTQKILRQYVGARASFRTALQLKPDYSEARTQLDILDKALSTGVVQVLEKIPILSKMTLEQSVLLAQQIQVEEFKPGQIVFHMGQMGDKFYIIEIGEVEVLAPDLRGQPGGVINRLGPGDFFGEIALLRAVPRTATIRIRKKTRLLAVSREDFDNVVRKFPSIANSVAETSSLRLLNDRQIGRRVELDRFFDPGYIAELTHQTEVTVLMGDIHGSTYLTNAIGPELMVAFLDEYLLRMSTIIVQAGGAIDKSLGDSVMGVFGNFPGRHEDEKVTSANSALLAALKMRQAYLTLRDEWATTSPEFSQTGMGIGISTGKITTGTVGAESTMVGPAVNMSSKLSKMAIAGRTESGIYIDNRTRSLIGDIYYTEPLDYQYTRKKVGVDLDAYRVTDNRT